MSEQQFLSGKRRVTSSRERGQFEVMGRDPHNPNLWMVRHPHGCECSGRWHSQEDAQKDCDRWNAHSAKLRAA